MFISYTEYIEYIFFQLNGISYDFLVDTEAEMGGLGECFLQQLCSTSMASMGDSELPPYRLVSSIHRYHYLKKLETCLVSGNDVRFER